MPMLVQLCRGVGDQFHDQTKWRQKSNRLDMGEGRLWGTVRTEPSFPLWLCFGESHRIPPETNNNPQNELKDSSCLYFSHWWVSACNWRCPSSVFSSVGDRWSHCYLCCLSGCLSIFLPPVCMWYLWYVSVCLSLLCALPRCRVHIKTPTAVLHFFIDDCHWIWSPLFWASQDGHWALHSWLWNYS